MNIKRMIIMLAASGVVFGGVLGFVESPQLPSSLQVPVRSRRVASDRLVVVVSPDHDWARRTRPVGLAELAATALVVREPGSGTRVSFEQAMDGFELADPALEVASNSAVRIAVAAGAGHPFRQGHHRLHRNDHARLKDGVDVLTQFDAGFAAIVV